MPTEMHIEFKTKNRQIKVDYNDLGCLTHDELAAVIRDLEHIRKEIEEIEDYNRRDGPI